MYDFLLVVHCKYSSALHHFATYFKRIWRWIISWPLKSGLDVTSRLLKRTFRKFLYGFLFVFHSNYGSVLYRFPDKRRYWSARFFSYPLHSTTPLWKGFPSEYFRAVWCRKTRGQSNLTKSASRGAHSPVRGHPRGSKFVPLNSWGRVSY